MAAVVGLLCGYELAALASRGYLPTITRVVHAGRVHDHRWVRAATVAVAATGVVWLTHHLMFEETHDPKVAGVAVRQDRSTLIS